MDEKGRVNERLSIFSLAFAREKDNFVSEKVLKTSKNFVWAAKCMQANVFFVKLSFFEWSEK